MHINIMKSFTLLIDATEKGTFADATTSHLEKVWSPKHHGSFAHSYICHISILFDTFLPREKVFEQHWI